MGLKLSDKIKERIVKEIADDVRSEITKNPFDEDYTVVWVAKDGFKLSILTPKQIKKLRKELNEQRNYNC